MNTILNRICFPKTDHEDAWEDPPEKRSLARTIIDLLLSPTYRFPRTVTTVRIYKGRNVFSVCPRCRNVIEYDYQSYCGSCGQYLDWSKIDNAEEQFIGWNGVEENN